MELQNTVKEVLNALYHNPDDAVRLQADRWLQDFQRTLDAWEASNSIPSFLSDIFDLGNSSQGKPYLLIRDSVIIPRGATLTRILVASLTGALPSSRLETVMYTLLALSRAYGVKTLGWAKESISLIPSTAVTEAEKSKFLQALSDAALEGKMNALTIPIEELSEVRRNLASVAAPVMVVEKPPLPQVTGNRRSQEPQISGKKRMVYLEEPVAENGSSSIVREDNSIDGKASDYINKVYAKIRGASNETTNRSAYIMPPPPRVVK